VRWYADQGFDTCPDHYHNIGDAFVFDSSLKLLRYSELKMLDIRNPSDAEIERYNSEYDYAFLRGSNYLHPAMDWENAPAVLEKLRIPIIAFGIGAQAPAVGGLELSEASKRVAAIIAERSQSLGVRGAYTADVLWSLGIKNVRIIGCPTVFRNRNPALHITLPPLQDVRRVAYTLRREVGHDYAQDLRRYLDLQRATILELAERFDLSLAAQGEIEEKAILWGNADQQAAAYGQLRAEGWLHGADDKLEDIYRTRLFYSDAVADYETKMRAQDLVIGYRLHGNLMGLANAIPAIYFTYDSRTVEFAETFAIPSFNVFAGKPFVLEEFWQQSLFDRFNRAYHQRHRDMRLFLDENGIPHNMIDETTPRAAASLERAA